MNKTLGSTVVVKNEVLRKGRFVIVSLEDEQGLRAVGISRKSDDDRFNYDTSLAIARGRAEKALLLKKKNKRINHPFMG